MPRQTPAQRAANNHQPETINVTVKVLLSSGNTNNGLPSAKPNANGHAPLRLSVVGLIAGGGLRWNMTMARSRLPSGAWAAWNEASLCLLSTPNGNAARGNAVIEKVIDNVRRQSIQKSAGL